MSKQSREKGTRERHEQTFEKQEAQITFALALNLVTWLAKEAWICHLQLHVYVPRLQPLCYSERGGWILETSRSLSQTPRDNQSPLVDWQCFEGKDLIGFASRKKPVNYSLQDFYMSPHSILFWNSDLEPRLFSYLFFFYHLSLYSLLSFTLEYEFSEGRDFVVIATFQSLEKYLVYSKHSVITALMNALSPNKWEYLLILFIHPMRKTLLHILRNKKYGLYVIPFKKRSIEC